MSGSSSTTRTRATARFSAAGVGKVMFGLPTADEPFVFRSVTRIVRTPTLQDFKKRSTDCRLRFPYRKPDGGYRASCRWGLDRERASMRLYQPLGCRQTQTGAACFRREEWRKESVSHVRRNARTPIRDTDMTDAAIGRDDNLNQATPLHRLCA